MRKRFILSSMIGLVLMSACSGDKVSFETQEQARKQALENATYNAKAWRDANYADAKIHRGRLLNLNVLPFQILSVAF